MSDLLARLWARLREAYEAELVHVAQWHRDRSARRHGLGPPHSPSFDLTVYDRATGELRVLLRGPRRLPLLAPLLSPVVLQFGLPLSLLSMAIRLAAGWGSGMSTPGALVAGGLGILVTTGLYSLLGRFMFSGRWRRLREEAYDRWLWRYEAARAAMTHTEMRAEISPDVVAARLARQAR